MDKFEQFEKDGTTILKDIKFVLDTLDLEFFLLFGTALGAVRDKKLIDGDYDIDIGLKHEVLKVHIDSIGMALVGMGYHVKNHPAPYGYPRMIKATKHNIMLDIVDLELVDDTRIHFNKPNGSCLVYPARLFEDMYEIEFYGMRFKVPTPCAEFLELTYGDWETPVSQHPWLNTPCEKSLYWQEVLGRSL